MTEPTDRTAESSAQVDRPERLGAAAIACVTLGLLTFPIAFNLGAYDQVLYPDVFRIIVASFVLLCVSFVAPTYPGRRLWFTRVVLVSPALWVAVSVIVLGSTAEATSRPFFIAWLTAIVLVSVPVTLMMLLDMFNPDILLAQSADHDLGERRGDRGRGRRIHRWREQRPAHDLRGLRDRRISRAGRVR